VAQEKAGAASAKQRAAVEYKDAEWIVEAEREARTQLEAMHAGEVRIFHRRAALTCQADLLHFPAREI
jgi:hypothetical protein